jgi:hypothetical protein
MSIEPIEIEINRALKLLRSFSCNNNLNSLADSEKIELIQALLLVVRESDWQNFGICADNSRQGFIALAAYLKQLGYSVNFTLDSVPSIDEPVYLKFNSQKMSYYVDTYVGEYRGVLVSCQGENDRINGTYGHFPLDLFG